MQNVINPPALSTFLTGWLRGGISVELSVAATWLLYSRVLGNGISGSLLPVLALIGVLWTVLVTVQCIRKFPVQRPLLTRTRSIRGGGGLRGARLLLSDFAGR